MQRSGNPSVDIFLVILPAALAAWAAFPEKNEI